MKITVTLTKDGAVKRVRPTSPQVKILEGAGWVLETAKEDAPKEPKQKPKKGE